MPNKGNSVQITTISKVSEKKLQDMPTVIRGIAKIAEDYPRIPKISRIFPRFFNIIGRFVNTLSLCVIMIRYLAIFS